MRVLIDIFETAPVKREEPPIRCGSCFELPAGARHHEFVVSRADLGYARSRDGAWNNDKAEIHQLLDEISWLYPIQSRFLEMTVHRLSLSIKYGNGKLEVTKFHSPAIQAENGSQLRTRRISARLHLPSKTSTPLLSVCEPAHCRPKSLG